MIAETVPTPADAPLHAAAAGAGSGADHARDGLCLLRSIRRNPPSSRTPSAFSSPNTASEDFASLAVPAKPAVAGDVAAPSNRASVPYLEMIFDIHDKRQAGTLEASLGSRPSSRQSQQHLEKRQQQHQQQQQQQLHGPPSGGSRGSGGSRSPTDSATLKRKTSTSSLSESYNPAAKSPTTINGKKKTVSFSHGNPPVTAAESNSASATPNASRYIVPTNAAAADVAHNDEAASVEVNRQPQQHQRPPSKNDEDLPPPTISHTSDFTVTPQHHQQQQVQEHHHQQQHQHQQQQQQETEDDPARVKEDAAAVKIQCAQRQRAARQELDKLKGNASRSQPGVTHGHKRQQHEQQPAVVVEANTDGLGTPPPKNLENTAVLISTGSANLALAGDHNLHRHHQGDNDNTPINTLLLSPYTGPAAPPCTPSVIAHHQPEQHIQPSAVHTSQPLVSPDEQHEQQHQNEQDERDLEQQDEQQQQQQQQQSQHYTARTTYHSTGRFGAQLAGELKTGKLVPHPPKTARALLGGDSPAPSSSPSPSGAARSILNVNNNNNNNNSTKASTAATSGEVLAQEEARGINSPPRSKRFIQMQTERQQRQHVSPRAPRMSDLPDDAVERANVLVARAQRLIERASNNSECDWNEVRELFFRAGTLYQDAQLHEEAGAAFTNAASVSRAVGDNQEVAAAASFAADSLRETDAGSAIENLLKLIAAYEASGNRLFLAREAKNLAQLYEEAVEDKELALKYYTMANQIYAERNNGKGRDGGTKSLYISTLRSMNFLAVELGRYKYAQSLADELSKQQPQWRTQWLLLACLCAIAEGNDPDKNPTAIIARAKRDFESYQDRERAFQVGFEYTLVKGILEAWEKHSLASFDQAQNRYENGRGVQVDVAREKNDRLAACFAALLEVCRENLFEFLRPYL